MRESRKVTGVAGAGAGVSRGVQTWPFCVTWISDLDGLDWWNGPVRLVGEVIEGPSGNFPFEKRMQGIELLISEDVVCR